MRYAKSASNKDRQFPGASRRRSSAGRNGLALAPPAYNIGFMDSAKSSPGTAESGALGTDRSGDGARPIANRGVTIHRNSPTAEKLDALAFTQGDHIHFAPGQWRPGTPEGNRLIRHELGHVRQQRSGLVRPTATVAGLAVNTDPVLEREADRLAPPNLGEDWRSPGVTAPGAIQMYPKPSAREVANAAMGNRDKLGRGELAGGVTNLAGGAATITKSSILTLINAGGSAISGIMKLTTAMDEKSGDILRPQAGEGLAEVEYAALTVEGLVLEGSMGDIIGQAGTLIGITTPISDLIKECDKLLRSKKVPELLLTLVRIARNIMYMIGAVLLVIGDPSLKAVAGIMITVAAIEQLTEGFIKTLLRVFRVFEEKEKKWNKRKAKDKEEGETFRRNAVRTRVGDMRRYLKKLERLQRLQQETAV